MVEEDTASASGFPQYSAQLFQCSGAEMLSRQGEPSTEGQRTSALCSGNDAGHPGKKPAHAVFKVFSFRSEQLQISAVDLPQIPCTGGDIMCPYLQTLAQVSGHLPEGLLCCLYPDGCSLPLWGFASSGISNTKSSLR